MDRIKLASELVRLAKELTNGSFDLCSGSGCPITASTKRIAFKINGKEWFFDDELNHKEFNKLAAIDFVGLSNNDGEQKYVRKRDLKE